MIKYRLATLKDFNEVQAIENVDECIADEIGYSYP